MNKIWHIFRYEIISTVTRRSFIFATIFLPLVMFGSVALMLYMDEKEPGTRYEAETPADVRENNAVANLDNLQMETEYFGFVDAAGLIAELPNDVPPSLLRRYTDEASALEAIENGEIKGYYLIPVDYVAQGNVIYIDPDFNSAQIEHQSQMIRWTLFYNMAGREPVTAQLARRPMNVKPSPISAPEIATETDDNCLRPGFGCETNPFVRYLPYISMMLLYMCILMSSSLLLNSVNEEKKNRVMETMMVSVSTRQLLTGKIIGLGLVAFAQIAIWAGMGYGFLELADTAINLPEGFSMPPGFWFWTIVFFLLGYAIYASLMAGVGAIAPNVKDVSWVSAVMAIPLFIAYMPFHEIADDVLNLNGALRDSMSTFYSMFPLSAPTAMVLRLTGEDVPLWQPVVSAVIAAITAVLIVRAIANLFRTQTLLSGEPFSFKRYFGTMFNRG
jgi:ABC-2 type transport system permease protein